jgi:hypothetical protein
VATQEEQNGKYPVRSGYRRYMRNRSKGKNTRWMEGDWNCLWRNIRAPPKAKHLLWRVCRDCSLPTRIRLRTHSVQCPAECPLCTDFDEDNWHLMEE